jgi:hypothetical protein
MNPEADQIPEAAAADIGPFARIAGVFFEPGKTFEDIGRRPSWLLPLALIVVSVLAFSITYGQHVGWEQVVRQQLENNPRAAQITPEQRGAAITQGVRLARIFSYLSVIAVPLSYSVIAAVLLGITAMSSAALKFRQVFAVVCYASLPTVLLSLLGIVTMFIKDPADFDIRNPLAFNLGAFLDPQSTSKFLYTLSTSLDLFSFWMIFLIATGLRAASRRNLSFGGALATVAVPWAIYVVGKAGLAGLFG